jgi:hypothetical protein
MLDSPLANNLDSSDDSADLNKGLRYNFAVQGARGSCVVPKPNVNRKLREHLGAVIATMRLSSDWHDFKAKLDKNYPPLGKATQLSFEYASDEDDGKGL